MSSTLRSDIPISGRTKISGANSAILPCTQNIRSTREKRIILCTSYERKNILEYEWNWLRWRKFNYHWRSVSWLVKMKKYCWQSKFCWRWWNVDDDDKNFASVRGSFSKSFFFLRFWSAKFYLRFLTLNIIQILWLHPKGQTYKIVLAVGKVWLVFNLGSEYMLFGTGWVNKILVRLVFTKKPN